MSTLYILEEVSGLLHTPIGNVWLATEAERKALSNLDFDSWRWTEITASERLHKEVEGQHPYNVLRAGELDRSVVMKEFEDEVEQVLADHNIRRTGFGTRRSGEDITIDACTLLQLI